MTPHRSTHPTRLAARASMALATMTIFGAAACSDPSAAAPLVTIPTFVYVADVGGYQSLVRYEDGATTALTSGSNSYEPNSAGGRLVFTSTRNVMPQIYVSDPGVATVRRVTNSNSFDVTASLSPQADSIAFVSTRSGTPRIWIINTPALDATTYDAPVALPTGSPDWVPESAPAWSPSGGTLAFTSTRDGMSQVYVIASGGGTPRKITNEMLGAFEPTWSPDGAMIYYIAATPALVLRRVSVSGGQATTIVDADNDGDHDVGGPMTCSGGTCLFSTDPTAAGGHMFALGAAGSTPQVVFTRTAAMERQPAILSQ